MPIYALAERTPEFPPEGRYWIADTATVIGRVRLGDEASVWWNAVLRGDTEWIEVGDRSQIQDNATLHTDPGLPLTVGADCVIGHNVILHGCTIAAHALVGMGAIILNGARINRNSIVAAGSVVPEGREYPENSLIVGAPARAIRKLEDATIHMIDVGVSRYVDRWKHYSEHLRRLG